MTTGWHQQAFYRISAVGLIRNEEGKYLLCDEHNRWAFPGGGWDYGESLHEALKRELYEEVALKNDFSERVVAAVPFYNPNKDAWQMWVACKIIHEGKLDFGVGEHVSAIRWMSRDEIDFTTEAGKLMEQVLEVEE